MKPVRRSAVFGLWIVLMLGAGCSTLPTSGEVTTEPGPRTSSIDQAPYFVPPGPVAGADPESIVRGFLLATQANPPSTSVARAFLSEAARSTWKPAGAIVYDTASLTVNAESVVARLTDANRIDRRGTWVAGDPSEVVGLRLELGREDGEWRILNPPSSLPVPAHYFRTTYLPYLLYFFDRSGTVLLPARVYLPRGEQIASSLVRGLLAGPTDALASASTTTFDSVVDLDLSVVIGESGVAEVPLSSAALRLSRGELYRLAVQLAATLRQVPGLERFRVTVGGVSLPLVDGQTEVSVNLAPTFDPVATSGEDAAAIADGRVVFTDEGGTRPVGGPFGDAGFALRSLAVATDQRVIAAVARNGRRAYLAPMEGERDPQRVRTVLDGATNLLRPDFDRFGNLWLIDVTSAGAVVHVVNARTDRVVTIRGISGKPVSAFTVTRDGGSLVAALATEQRPSLLVSSLVRGPGGGLQRAEPVRRVEIGGEEPGVILDLAQSSATAVAVLTRSSLGDQVRSAEMDGSPGQAFSTSLLVLPGEGLSVLARPNGQGPTRVVTAAGQLLGWSTSQGAWVTSLTDVLAATYPQ